ncbi:MAG: molybdopterin-guanine dinucleotide biosynthesis protein B [Pseudomonadota bacterium]
MTVAAIDAPRIGVVGWKNAGKTTLAAGLIAELTARGLLVASVKSAHHAFQIDNPNTDSGRHAAAGAAQTAIVGGARWAIMANRAETNAPELSVDDILSRMSPCDIVILEGFKGSPHAKIEVRGDSKDQSHLSEDDPNIIAIACDNEVQTGLPVFKRNALVFMTDFVLKHAGIET